MKTTIFSILLTISSIAFADDKLNFDIPAHENAAKALEELCKTMSEVMGDAQ